MPSLTRKALAKLGIVPVVNTTGGRVVAKAVEYHLSAPIRSQEARTVRVGYAFDGNGRSLILTLPEPPSSNRYWRYAIVRKRPVVLLSAEARAYRKAVREGTEPCIPWDHFPLMGPVAITLTWYRGRKSGDLDNRIKQVLDALKGIAYGDDAQVAHIWALRKDDKGNARVEVQVTEFAP